MAWNPYLVCDRIFAETLCIKGFILVILGSEWRTDGSRVIPASAKQSMSLLSTKKLHIQSSNWGWRLAVLPSAVKPRPSRALKPDTPHRLMFLFRKGGLGEMWRVYWGRWGKLGHRFNSNEQDSVHQSSASVILCGPGRFANEQKKNMQHSTKAKQWLKMQTKIWQKHHTF